MLARPPFIHTTIQVASMRQINAAIEHLQRLDFECAITLAAAAEGILPETHMPHFFTKVKALEASLPDDEGANAVINWLKHGTLTKGGPRIDKAEIKELEAIAVIWRAITKFQAVYGATPADRTPQMLGFQNWARAYLENPDKTLDEMARQHRHQQTTGH
jgi:hypothetical protein